MEQLAEKLTRKGRVKIELFGSDGLLKERRQFDNVITEVGDAHVADQLSSAPGESAMSHMAIGTGSTAAATGDTALDSEIDRNALTSRTQGAAAADNDVIYVGDWAAADGTGAIVEAGIFNSSSGGTLLCRQVFAVVNKGASDTLKITWTVSIGD